VPFTALTSNQFAEGMKKILELEPLIKLRLAPATEVPIMQMSRIQVFSELLSRALEELHKRDFSLLSLKELLALINQMENKFLREGEAVSYITDQPTSWDLIEPAAIDLI